MRVIFVNRYFYPDFSATSQMLSDLAFDLAADGCDVTVLTSKQIYDAPRARLAARESLDGVRVLRLATTRFGRGGAAGRLLDYLSFHLAVAWMLMVVARRGDIVVAKTDPPLLSITAALVTRLRGAVLVNWLQDLFPEVAHAAAVNSRFVGGLLRALLRWRNRSLRLAACNVAVGRLMARHLAAQGIADECIRVIENWCDGARVRPIARDQNRLRAEWGLGQSFVVGYSGNLGVVHEFDTMLEAAEQLKARGDIVFLFIGAGARRAALEEQAAARGLSNVKFRPYQHRKRLAESLSVADAHLVCLRDAMEGLVVPSKFYGVIAAGRPCLFVGNPQGEIPTLLRDLGCGHSVAPGDAVRLAHLITELADEPGLARAMGAEGRRAFEERFERAMATKRWVEVLQDALRSRVADERSAADLPS